MSQDLAAILTGAPAKSAAPPAASPAPNVDPSDAAIRTIYGEAPPNASPDELRAIASVIVNRAAASGKPFDQVVQEPGQFEAWHNPQARQRIEALKSTDPKYQAIASTVGDILSGKANPNPDLVNFYAPDAQKALGRDKPGFDDGSGTRIGAHLFFSGAKSSDLGSLLAGGKSAVSEDQAHTDFAKTFGDPKSWDEAAGKADLTGLGLTPYRDLPKQTLPKNQQDLFSAMVKGDAYDPKAPAGSAMNPFFMQAGVSEKDVPKGSYYVDREEGPTGGRLHLAGEKGDSSFSSGLSRGVGDVALSLGHMMPGSDDSTLKNRMMVDQEVYDANRKGDLKSGIGRFIGQVAGSAPLLAGGEAALGAKALGGVGEFITGRFALKGAPKLAQIAARTGSMATSGAIEGSGAAALTSSASDEPIQDQMATGALIGAPLKPLAGAVGGGMRRFFGPKAATAGADTIDQQQLRTEMAKGLPVQVPMTQGQITGAPAQQLDENAMLRGAHGDPAAKVMQEFRDTQQAALRANVDKIAGDMAGGKDVGTGDGGAAVSKKLNELRDASKKSIDSAYTAARAKGDDAMLASAAEARDAMLTGLRKGYNLKNIEPVAREVEDFGSGGAPTVREVFDLRTRLGNLGQSSDTVVAGAARVAKSQLDGYMNVALKNDLLLGDPKAVKSWRTAIAKRAEFGKIFEGDDLVEDLTDRASRGGEYGSLKVDPADATNLIFGKSALGFVGKKNLKRDLDRLKDVLGEDSDEWNALRSEAFKRIARAGEGAAEAGQPQFSGQKFFNAWTKVKKDDPLIVERLFTPDEVAVIDRFGEISQRVTSPVKGGDNTSNSAFAMKNVIEKWAPYLLPSGGATAGAAVGGPLGAAGGAAVGAFFDALRQFVSAGKAVRVTKGARPMAAEDAGLKNKLLPTLATEAAAIAGNRLAGPSVSQSQ